MKLSLHKIVIPRNYNPILEDQHLPRFITKTWIKGHGQSGWSYNIDR